LLSLLDVLYTLHIFAARQDDHQSIL